jgi:hypothetical protein
MKTKLVMSGLLVLAPMLIGQLALHAQGWQTVDDFSLANGDAVAHGIAIDAAGGIYVVGTANGHGIVRYSADDGLHWTTRDDFVYPTETNSAFNAVTVDPNGAVYVGGMGAGAHYFLGHWIVRRSTDHGLTWQTVDDYYQPIIPPDDFGIFGVVDSLANDGQGRIYGGGIMEPRGPSYPSWWIRGSSIGGTNWNTELLAFGGYTTFAQLTCAGEVVYATGSINGADFPAGLVLRSSDHGATWTTVFDVIADFPTALTADSAGNLYSAGYSMTSNSIIWLVRELAPGGTSWTTLDRSETVLWAADGSPLPGDHFYPSARSIAVDAAGDVLVTGVNFEYLVTYFPNGYSVSGGSTWFTRQYQAATGQWSTTDLFSYSTNKSGAALGAAIAPSGSMFTVGIGTSDSGQQHWIVRKQAPVSPPTALLAALKKDVNDLIAQSAIARQPGSVLLGFLDGIDAKLARGNAAPVCGQLGAFINKVQAYMKQGALSPSNGQMLLNGADNLRQALGCR